MGGRSSKQTSSGRHRDYDRACRLFGNCYEKDAEEDFEKNSQMMSSSQSTSPSQIGAIFGGIVGGVVVVILLSFAVRKYREKKR